VRNIQDVIFHTYAVWWGDAKTVKYYLNNVHVVMVSPSTKLSQKPFSRPMQINIVTETYDWETPPTPEELADNTINTSYYDWVRAYRLVKIGEEKKSEKALTKP